MANCAIFRQNRIQNLIETCNARTSSVHIANLRYKNKNKKFSLLLKKETTNALLTRSFSFTNSNIRLKIFAFGSSAKFSEPNSKSFLKIGL